MTLLDQKAGVPQAPGWASSTNEKDAAVCQLNCQSVKNAVVSGEDLVLVGFSEVRDLVLKPHAKNLYSVFLPYAGEAPVRSLCLGCDLRLWINLPLTVHAFRPCHLPGFMYTNAAFQALTPRVALFR